jgi:tight adherence protein C
MGLAIFTFVAIFVLIASGGLLIFYRASLSQRLSSAISPQIEQESWWSWLKIDRAGDSLKAVVQPFDKILPKSPAEVSVSQQRLIRAGFRQDAHIRILYGAKVLVPVFLCVMVFVTGLSEYLSPFFAYTLAAGLGYLLPDFWLGRRISNRQMNIRLGLPEVLDLMVVCIEAGLSLDQAVSRSVAELDKSQPEISDELSLVQLEQRAGRPRIDAWKHFAERANIVTVTTLVSALAQADQFGTSIAKTLRVYSDTLRVQRRQEVEERAAKTTVKLVFPLVFFIFPSLYVVALGPAAIVMYEAFLKYFHY